MNHKTRRRKTGKIISGLIILYLTGGVVLYFLQDKILFHPKALPKNHSFSFEQAFEELNFPFGKENISILKFKPPNQRKGIVLFYHGNMENAEHYKKYPVFFLRNGYELWMIDYPGFGKTTGRRSEKIIYNQALILYTLASEQTHWDSILIYGKSIGTGIASYVAANKKSRQLILESPYYGIDALAKHYFPLYPVSLMSKYSFPIHTYLKQVKVPITILHGTNDEIIPYNQSKRLKKENPEIQLVGIEKGKHNNLSNFSLFQSTLDSLLQH